jgi:dual-specificity kinase
MSTPSTATSTLPAHHSQYGYAQHNPYSNNACSYPATNSVPAPRLTNSYHSFHPANTTQVYSRPQPPPIMTKLPSQSHSIGQSQSTSALPGNERRVDWNEFYKNGIPKEVIVIDDDSPPPKQQPQTTTSRLRGAADAPQQTTTGRKRKVDQGYEVEYHDSPTFSAHPAKFGDSSSVSVDATDRTASLQTTAPTSLESYRSTGASNSYEDVRVGQKRKRAQPQKETRAQLRRKQQEAASDAFADYVPPSKPLRKAPDVHVPVVRDVSS